MKRCGKNDFISKNTPALARSLLGSFLVCVRGDSVLKKRITDVEAYDGPEDAASHARFGRTARNSIMFDTAGHWYVYLVYGMHELLNITTGPVGYPAAILIRGVEGVEGPGRLTRALGISRTHNGLSVYAADTVLYSEKGNKLPRSSVEALPRVGVRFAGPFWARKPYRFRIKEGA
jgi:DNA-3-methyladenine glycosylase